MRKSRADKYFAPALDFYFRALYLAGKKRQGMTQTINYPGTDRKFMVTCTQEDFLMTEDDFEIIVIDPYRRQRRTTKQGCFFDSNGRCYFRLENPRTGTYYAWFKGWQRDDDYDKHTRQFTDGQMLCEVGLPSCRCSEAEGNADGNAQKPDGCQCIHVVQYTEVTTVSIDGEEYLTDMDGQYILTSDGKRIAFQAPENDKPADVGKVRMNMTGEEFLRKWEGRSPNGEIDTVPEMLDALRGINDDETVQQDVDERIDLKIGENNEETEVDRVSAEDLEGFQV